MSELEILFQEYTHENPVSITELSASGSNRRYFRLKSINTSVIGVAGTSIDENCAFIYMSNHFFSKGLPVPKVLAQTTDGKFYLQEDLGDISLFDCLAERNTCNFEENEKILLHKTMKQLPLFQVKGADGFDFSICYPQPEFNFRTILWDLNYFKYCFLKLTGLEFQENRLEDDFTNLANILLQSQTDTFMYRDFQSRNVMVKNNKPYFIDFQGGRKGPLQYDVASFLWQAKAKYNTELREELLQTYLLALQELMPVNEDDFRKQLKHFVVFRTLQVLGAYGFRGFFEKKSHFLQSIPFAMDNLRMILQDELSDYPYLFEVLKQMSDLKQFIKPVACEVSDCGALIVTVHSFSYRKGIPDDKSGNGGGFVFDCRAINNPGKYERFMRCNGLDQSVIEFLEDDGEILAFLENSFNLVDASIKRYIERGFNNLMISFGCTGGQHRSVYSAQKTAEHISQKFGIEVHLIHREQNIDQIFPALK